MAKKKMTPNEKLEMTPYERGFKCMMPDSCQMCIKAAEEGQTVTVCEDELNEGESVPHPMQFEQHSRMGIVQAPWSGEFVNQQGEDVTAKSYNVWRAWMRLDGGGIMGLPYPAKDAQRAEELAEKAAEIFGGHLTEIENLGTIQAKRSGNVDI